MGTTIFLFAAIWKSISKLGSIRTKSPKSELKRIESGKHKFLEECENAINYYLRKNKGKAFNTAALINKMDDIVNNPKLKEYLTKNIKAIMERMINDETAAYYEINGEIYYFL